MSNNAPRIVVVCFVVLVLASMGCGNHDTAELRFAGAGEHQPAADRGGNQSRTEQGGKAGTAGSCDNDGATCESTSAHDDDAGQADLVGAEKADVLSKCPASNTLTAVAGGSVLFTGPSIVYGWAPSAVDSRVKLIFTQTEEAGDARGPYFTLDLRFKNDLVARSGRFPMEGVGRYINLSVYGPTPLMVTSPPGNAGDSIGASVRGSITLLQGGNQSGDRLCGMFATTLAAADGSDYQIEGTFDLVLLTDLLFMPATTPPL